jgi:hypothetical protein
MGRQNMHSYLGKAKYETCLAQAEAAENKVRLRVAAQRRAFLRLIRQRRTLTQFFLVGILPFSDLAIGLGWALAHQ